MTAQYEETTHWTEYLTTCLGITSFGVLKTWKRYIEHIFPGISSAEVIAAIQIYAKHRDDFRRPDGRPYRSPGDMPRLPISKQLRDIIQRERDRERAEAKEFEATSRLRQIQDMVQRKLLAAPPGERREMMYNLIDSTPGLSSSQDLHLYKAIEKEVEMPPSGIPGELRGISKELAEHLAAKGSEEIEEQQDPRVCRMETRRMLDAQLQRQDLQKAQEKSAAVGDDPDPDWVPWPAKGE